MGGGDDAARGTRARSDMLEGISQKPPVPHMFILDRDERGRAEVSRLESSLAERVHLLQRRELENYLLVPTALLSALRSKHNDKEVLLRKIESTSEEEISNLIRTTADGLYGLVLVKRIRAELADLKGGLLTREAVSSLMHKIRYKNFPRIIRSEIESRIARHLGDLDVEQIVATEMAELDDEWSDSASHLRLAPGEEVIAVVFHHFVVEYKKPNDTVRIAQAMKTEDVFDEIHQLIRKVLTLANHVG